MVTEKNSVFKLLIKGIKDSGLQFIATTFSRLILIASIPLLAFFIEPQEIARFDLFLITSNLLLIFLSMGADSGIAIVIKARTEHSKLLLLIGSLVIVLLMSLFAALPIIIMSFGFVQNMGLHLTDLVLSFVYSIFNTIILMVFSFYRWLGKAKKASFFVIIGSFMGLVLGYSFFLLFKNLLGLLIGLSVGSFIGALLCLTLSFRDLKIGAVLRSIRPILSSVKKLLHISWPFMIASLLLLSRRVVDRGILLGFGSLAALGSYAIVSRTGELVAFALAVPAIGFSPLILRHAKEVSGKRLARLLYNIYVIFSVVITAAAYWAWIKYGSNLFPSVAENVAPVFMSVIVGSLLFGQTTVAGYGYVIQSETKMVAVFSGLFILLYILFALPFFIADQLINAIGVGFVMSSLIYSAIFIWISERKFSMGYSQFIIQVIYIILAASALTQLDY